MIRSVKFSQHVQFISSNGYCICSLDATHAQVVISLRLKEIIEQSDWSQLLPEDIEELRSFLELGFIVEEVSE